MHPTAQPLAPTLGWLLGNKDDHSSCQEIYAQEGLSTLYPMAAEKVVGSEEYTVMMVLNTHHT